jgi:hypothetical protein
MEDIIYISSVKDISFIADITHMSAAADITANYDLLAHGVAAPCRGGCDEAPPAHALDHTGDQGANNGDAHLHGAIAAQQR